MGATEVIDLHGVLSAASVDVFTIGKSTIWSDGFDVDIGVGKVLEYCVAVIAGLLGHGESLILNVAGHMQLAIWNGVVLRVYNVDREGGISEDEVKAADEWIAIGVQAEK